MHTITQSPSLYGATPPTNYPYPEREALAFLPTKLQPVINQTPRILIVESKKASRDLLCIALQRAGYEVIMATSGTQALLLFEQATVIDLVLVEAALLGIDGYTICAEIRKRSHVPIVLLSELSQIDQVIYGFTMGADDYIVKPFYFPVLAARLQAIFRRTAPWMTQTLLKPQIMAIDEIVLNAELREVSVRDQPVSLSPIEYELLRYLMHMVDRPVSKQELFQNVWRYRDTTDVNLVRVGVHRLREKIEKDPTHPVHLLTVPGFGYKFQTLQTGSTN